MLGPEKAKKFMYGSDHASQVHGGSEAKHVSHTQDFLKLEGQDKDKKETQSVAGRAQKSSKAKSSFKNRDEVSISGHGTEVGGAKSPMKMKWNSTKQQSAHNAQNDLGTDDISNTDMD